MNLIDYNINTLLFAILMSFRLGAFFRTLPSFADVQLKGVLTVFLPVGMAFLLAPVLSYDVMPIMTSSVWAITLAIVGEVLVGSIMGFSVNLVMSFASMIGELVGMEAGFSMASLFDPNLGQISVVSYFTRNIFLMALFIFNVHHNLIMGLIQSYEAIPVGANFISFAEIVPQMIKLFANIYFMAFRIVLPIIIIILLSHLTMGVISITAPEMNIYFNAAVTMNVIVALVLFAISMPTIFKFFNVALGQYEDLMGALFMSAR